MYSMISILFGFELAVHTTGIRLRYPIYTATNVFQITKLAKF